MTSGESSTACSVSKNSLLCARGVGTVSWNSGFNWQRFAAREAHGSISLNAERPIRCVLLSRLGYLLLRIKSPKQLSVTIKV